MISNIFDLKIVYMYDAKSYVNIIKKLNTLLTSYSFQIVIDEINPREFYNQMQLI